MILTRKENEKLTINRYMVYCPVSEVLSIQVYLNSIIDGTGKELVNELILLGKRQDNSLIRIDPYWLFQQEFIYELTTLNELTDNSFRSTAMKSAMVLRDQIRQKREEQLNRLSSYLDNTFKKQIDNLIERRSRYEQENDGNRNDALINQVNANLIDVEMRKERRLALVQRQKNIGMKPPKLIAQLEVIPRGKSQRLISIDYKDLIQDYERQNGRTNLKIFHPFSLVDFYSERFNKEPRFIIVSDDEMYCPSEEYSEDLKEIEDQTFIYFVKDDIVKKERKLTDLPTFIQI